MARRSALALASSSRSSHSASHVGRIDDAISTQLSVGRNKLCRRNPTRFQRAKLRRQVIIATHNANLIVNTDADQVIVTRCGNHEPGRLPRMSYVSGGLEERRSVKRSVPSWKVASVRSRSVQSDCVSRFDRGPRHARMVSDYDIPRLSNLAVSWARRRAGAAGPLRSIEEPARRHAHVCTSGQACNCAITWCRPWSTSSV
jgi:hypothetical protein